MSILLSAAGIAATFWWLDEDFASLGLVPFWAILVGALLVVVNYAFGAIRLALLTSLAGSPVGLGRSLRAYALGLFGAAITPGGGGQAPALVLSLIRDGVPAPKAWSVTVYVWILDLVFLIWSVPVGLMSLRRASRALGGWSPWLVGGTVVATFLVILTVLLFGQGWLRRALGSVMRLRWLRRWRGSTLAFMDRLEGATKTLTRAGLGRQLTLHALTAGLYIATYLTFYVVAAGVGGKPPLVPAMAAVQLPMVISFLFPTPGGSGILEVFAASLFATEGVRPGIGAAILAWRVLTFYSRFAIGPALGGSALLRRKRPANDDAHPS